MNSSKLTENNPNLETDPGQVEPISEPVSGIDATAVKAKSSKGSVVKIHSLEQLLREIYESAKPRLKLERTEILAIGSDQSVIGSELLSLAKNDRTLDRTWQLMLINTNLEGPAAKAQITEFVRNVLIGHPAFHVRPLSDFLDGKLGVTEDQALRGLVSQNYTSLPWPSDMPPLKKVQATKCKSNALQCFLLLIWPTADKSLTQLLSRLRTHVWARSGTGKKSESQLALALMQSRDAATAIVYDILTTENAKIADVLEAARDDEQRAVSRAKKAELKLSELEANVEEQQTRIDELTEQLRSLKEEFANYKSLATDQYETIRGRVLGRLRSELSLLDTGLQALRRDPPKVHVMIDHADRAIEGLKGEIAKLEE